MTVCKTGLTQSITEDSLKFELAKVQYVALQTDSALQVYYGITDELGIKLALARKELNRHIKDKEIQGVVNKDLSLQLVKANNKLYRSRMNNLLWFGVGNITGGVIGIVGIISIAVVAK